METPKRRVRKAVQSLKEFVERDDKAEKVFEWELHPDKGDWAATKHCAHVWLRKWDTIPSQIKTEIKVLAVTNNFTAHKRRPADPKQWVKMHTRLDRIRRATWAVSAWRHRTMLWNALGCQINPDFALNMNSVRHEAWKARRGKSQVTTQWKAAAEALGWEVTEQTDQVITPDGVLNFNWDGEATIREAVKRSWTRKLWKLDKRCPDFEQESAEIPILKAHIEVATNVLQPGQKQVALMAFVPRGFLRSVIKKQEGGEKLCKRWKEMGDQAFSCMCGAERVNIEHFMWDCKSESTIKPRALFRGPRTSQERKALAPSCVPNRASEADFEELIRGTAKVLKGSKSEWTAVASDGGSERKKSYTRPGAVARLV